MSFPIFCILSHKQKTNVFFPRNTLSKSRDKTRGDSQGLIFELFMFSLYINNMPEIIDNPFFFHADDTKIIENWFELS